ncbi:protein lev-9-like [Ahaetulla prasina]|uniref:protein lev-9-like n=1 Tax=Ahaetulla prasina TaxID=499056 RepID=UPI00264991B5|nr:protein lev-9-like [Ahaetulla prasina]
MSGLVSLLLLLLLLFSCQISEGSKHVEARNITETNCPSRKKNSAVRTGHVCQRSCERRQCSRTRKCECDGKCGLSCISPALRCPWPVTVDNAETHLAQESHVFGDFMTVTCQSGYRILDGQEMSVSRCQGDGKWSVTARCEEVFTFANVCKPPPEIENGNHENGPYTIGKEILYMCKSGYWLQGSNSLRCQENEEWSDNAPTCHPVTCSRPPNIAQSTLVAVHQSEYPVGTVIYYLCQKDFFLDGSNRVICLKNGTWSNLPYCRARCPVIVQRSRMIYNGHKVWAYEIPNGFVHHGETITFFCRSQNKTCNFEVESHCYDGVLKIPDCYDEPTYLQYHLFPKRVVSEIGAC